MAKNEQAGKQTASKAGKVKDSASSKPAKNATGSASTQTAGKGKKK